jgi:hypothetical protein
VASPDVVNVCAPIAQIVFNPTVRITQVTALAKVVVPVVTVVIVLKFPVAACVNVPDALNVSVPELCVKTELASEVQLPETVIVPLVAVSVPLYVLLNALSKSEPTTTVLAFDVRTEE